MLPKPDRALVVVVERWTIIDLNNLRLKFIQIATLRLINCYGLCDYAAEVRVTPSICWIAVTEE